MDLPEETKKNLEQGKTGIAYRIIDENCEKLRSYLSHCITNKDEKMVLNLLELNKFYRDSIGKRIIDNYENKIREKEK